MTPKHKAEELFDKMSTNNGDEYHHCTYYVAKQCALIAVDEIILIAPMMHMEGFGNLTIREYYKKVKQEIDKL
jgi:hypothetical protein